MFLKWSKLGEKKNKFGKSQFEKVTIQFAFQMGEVNL